MVEVGMCSPRIVTAPALSPHQHRHRTSIVTAQHRHCTNVVICTSGSV
jgi:hypothetical protein